MARTLSDQAIPRKPDRVRSGNGSGIRRNRRRNPGRSSCVQCEAAESAPWPEPNAATTHVYAEKVDRIRFPSPVLARAAKSRI